MTPSTTSTLPGRAPESSSTPTSGVGCVPCSTLPRPELRPLTRTSANGGRATGYAPRSRSGHGSWPTLAPDTTKASLWRRWSAHEFVMLASRVARLLAWCGQGPASKKDLLCASDAKTCRCSITSLCVDEWHKCGRCVYYSA
ncbi:unnamed protein product [Ixodes pacificus]